MWRRMTFLFAVLVLPVHVSAAEVYEWAAVSGTIADYNPAASPTTTGEIRFSDGGQTTRSIVNESLPFSAATGDISVAGRTSSLSGSATSVNLAGGGYQTGKATLTGRLASGFEVVSSTLAPGTPVTANLEWILTGAVDHSYGYARAGFSATARLGGLVGPNSSLFNFDVAGQGWEIGDPVGALGPYGPIEGGRIDISRVLTGTETLRVGDIFTIKGDSSLTAYSYVYGGQWEGWANASLNARFNLTSPDAVVFRPLAAVPLPASLPLLVSGLLGMGAFLRRGSRVPRGRFH